MRKRSKTIGCVFLAAAILLGAAGCLKFLKNSQAGQTSGQTSAGLSFQYAGITDGEAPDGTAFGAGKIQDTLEELLQESGTEAEVAVTAAGEGGREIPNTSYRISLCIEGADADTCRDILEELLNRYRDWFHDTYYQNPLMDEADPYLAELLDQAEYREIEAIVKAETGKWKRYLSGKEDGLPASLQAKIQSLADQISAFESVTLPAYSAYVEQSGISDNQNESVLTLSWQLWEAKRDYELNMASYQIALSGIELYDAAMSNSVLVPTLDQSSAFYMSRTKIGVDYLAETAGDYLDWSEGARNRALSLENTLGKLQAEGSAYADRQRKKIKGTMETFQESIRELDEEIWEALEPVRIEVGK